MTTTITNIEYQKRIKAKNGILELTVYREGLPRMCPVDEMDFGVLVGLHPEIDAGAKAMHVHEFPSWEIWANQRLPRRLAVNLPVFVYQKDNRWHVSTKKMPEEWNWVQFGYYYITKDELEERFKRRSISKRMCDVMARHMRKYLSYMEDWLNNDVFEYVATIDGKVVACDCGFYLNNDKEAMIQEIIHHAAREGHRNFKLLLPK